MSVFWFAFAIAAVAFIACTLLHINRYGVKALGAYIKRIHKAVIILSLLACIVLVCLLGCYSSLSVALKDVLSVDTVENIKTTLKTLSGAESSLFALQTFALLSALLSFASCVVCIFGEIIVFVLKTYFACERVSVEEEDEELAVDGYTCKAFLVYSRFNS